MALLVILGPFTYSTYLTVIDFINKKPGDYRWPQFSDFWYMGVAGLVFFVIERTMNKILYPIFLPYCKE
jgi:hypothetical protein